MTKKHVFFYDLMLPSAFIAATGWLLSQVFGVSVFRKAAAIELWGIGSWFVSSNFGRDLWEYRWPLFCIPVGLIWLVWIRLNLHYDIVNYRYRMERPLFFFFERFFQWIDGGNPVTRLQLAYEQRLAAAHDTIQALEKRLHSVSAGTPKPESTGAVPQATLPTVFPEFSMKSVSENGLRGPEPAFPTVPVQGAPRFSDTVTRLRLKAEEMQKKDPTSTTAAPADIVVDKRWDSLKI